MEIELPNRKRPFRGTSGSWRPGQSGNLKGRPKEDPEVKEILKAACPAAAMKLVELLDCANPKIVLSAATAILDRVYGKPKESVDMNVTQDDNLSLHIRGVLLDELKRKKDNAECECDEADDDDEQDGSREFSERTITFSFD